MTKNLSLPLMGALFMCLAMMLFGSGNAIVKNATQNQIPICEIIAIRSLFGVVFLLFFMGCQRKFHLLKTHNFPLQLLRGVLGFVALFCLFASFDLLPLADATAFTFAIVLFVGLLSFPLLKEKVGMHRTIAILVGFVGVMVIAQPTGNVTLYGSFVALVSAALESLVMLYGKKLSREDAVVTCVFYHTLICFLIGAVASFFYWTPIDWPQVLFFAALAFFGIAGQSCIVKAYTLAPAPVVAPFLYTLMIWGVLFGYLFWGEMPSTNLYIGAPIIILSGLYIIHRENKKPPSHVQELID